VTSCVDFTLLIFISHPYNFFLHTGELYQDITKDVYVVIDTNSIRDHKITNKSTVCDSANLMCYIFMSIHRETNTF
jgi:hypothetical protein